MFSKKYTTFQWIYFWGIMTIILAWIEQQTQESWTFYIVLASFVILVSGLVWQGVKKSQKRFNLQKIVVRYLIPRRSYPNGVSYQDAPEVEGYPQTLTVGIGKYVLSIQLLSKIDLSIDPIRVVFEGKDTNKPRIEGKDSTFIREKLEDGSYRDWWGDVHKPATEYPRRFYRKDVLMVSNIVTTFGQWEGKIHVQVPIIEVGIIDRYLDFIVSTNKGNDNVPFLQKSDSNHVVYQVDSTTNISRPLSSESRPSTAEW